LPKINSQSRSKIQIQNKTGCKLSHILSTTNQNTQSVPSQGLTDPQTFFVPRGPGFDLGVSKNEIGAVKMLAGEIYDYDGMTSDYHGQMSQEHRERLEHSQGKPKKSRDKVRDQRKSALEFDSVLGNLFSTFSGQEKGLNLDLVRDDVLAKKSLISGRQSTDIFDSLWAARNLTKDINWRDKKLNLKVNNIHVQRSKKINTKGTTLREFQNYTKIAITDRQATHRFAK
jgi:hypothetical protein